MQALGRCGRLALGSRGCRLLAVAGKLLVFVAVVIVVVLAVATVAVLVHLVGSLKGPICLLTMYSRDFARLSLCLSLRSACLSVCCALFSPKKRLEVFSRACTRALQFLFLCQLMHTVEVICFSLESLVIVLSAMSDNDLIKWFQIWGVTFSRY